MDTYDHTECEEKLKMAHEALIRSEQLALAGRFAGGVMHEVNNPLEALGNLIYLARHSANDAEDVRRFLAMAEEQLACVQTIARRTLSFYRQPSKHQNVNVIEILDAALHMQQPQLLTKSIDVCRTHPESAILQANAGELLQIFVNLIANAVHALSEKGQLHVRVSESADQLNILIADNGRGIADEQTSRLYEPFATHSKETGTGLGLWMSKALIERRRGRIRHRTSTRPGRNGTAFRISIPK